MIRDEFNNVEVTNDKQLLRVEFGKTQAAEFTSKKENTVPEGDLNEKYVGKTIKKETEINVDYINKVPTHATQTVVQSTTTASGAAAATATTAVAASTVAVVAIATVTGISVALHDYKCEFKSLIISSNELRYSLVVYDALISEEEYYQSFSDQDQMPIEEGRDENGSAPFKLRVYNKNYDSSQYLWSYSPNEGIFSNLTLGDTYNIVVTENRYGGEEIFSDTFTTYKNSTITDFTLYQYIDAELGTFDYYLDYVDDDDSIAEIALEFYLPGSMETPIATFPLEKESGFRTINTRNTSDNLPSFLEEGEWAYKVNYIRNRESYTYKEGTIEFLDYLGRKTEFRSFTLDREANFVDNSITVQLDYDDGFGYYSNFSLELTLVPTTDNQTNPDDYYSQEIPLQAVTSKQTIVLNEYEMYVRDSYFKYTYRLYAEYQGSVIMLDEETTPFSFTDNSGGVTEFRGIDFSKEANFLNNTFKVKLNYQDDFNDLFNFTLHLYPEGVNAQYDFQLEVTTEEQTCTFDPDQHWNFSFDYTYGCTLTYWNYDEEKTVNVEDSFVFTDISGGVSEFNGVTFTGNYRMSTGLAAVQLDYQDDFGYLSNFALHLFGPITNQGNGTNPNPFRADSNDIPEVEDYPYEISLEKTTEVQYFSLYEYDIPPATEEGSYLYAITYDYRNEPAEPVKGAEPIVFDDPDAESEFRDIIFVNGEANFNERSFYVQLDYVDDFGYFYQFALLVSDGDNGGWVEKQLEATTEPQLVTIDEYDYEDSKYPVDIISGDLSYNLSYVSSETGDPATQYLYEQYQPLSFVNSLHSEFYGLESSFDITQDASTGECRLPFRFDLVNDAEYFSAPELYVTSVEDEEQILGVFYFANETMHNGWQYGSFSPNGDFTVEDLTDGNEYNLVVACYEKDGYEGSESRVIKYCEPHSFTLNQNHGICGIDMQNYISGGEYQGYLTLVGNGDFTTLENGQIIFESCEDETVLIYDLTLSEFVQFDFLSPKNRTATEQFIDDFFSHPVNISFKYSEPGSQEVITLDCFTNFLFQISH